MRGGERNTSPGTTQGGRGFGNPGRGNQGRGYGRHGRYQSAIYGATSEERVWRKNAKFIEIFLDVTVWLDKKNSRKFPYEMKDGMPHLRCLLEELISNDNEASLVNRFETEKGGGRKTLIHNTRRGK